MRGKEARKERSNETEADRYFVASSPLLSPQKRGDFVAIAADFHGAPAAATGAGIVVEEEAAGGIGAATDGSARAFDEELACGAGNGRKEPVEAGFASNKFQGPGTVVEDEFVVAFGDAEDFVDGFSPGHRVMPRLDNGRKDGAQRLAQAQDTQEDGIHGVGLVEEKRAQAGSAVFGNQVGVDQERQELVPGEVVSRGR